MPRYMLLVLLCLVLTAADIHFIVTKVGAQAFAASVDASEGVVKGLPHWRLYQARCSGHSPSMRCATQLRFILSAPS